MRRFGVNPNDIDAILVSHLHGDHFGGIPFFVLDAQLISKRTRPLVIAGPPGLAARARDAMEALFPGSSNVQRQFDLVLIQLPQRKPAQIGAVKVTPYEVVHASGAPAFALRLECDRKVIAYSGDTEWTEALVNAARGADLFICEAYFFEKKVRYHLDYKTLKEHREELGCQRLILTHMSGDMLGRVEGLDVECADDGKEIVL
jgi:ribonuclease BN (tRNA processing enzyme)